MRWGWDEVASWSTKVAISETRKDRQADDMQSIPRCTIVHHAVKIELRKHFFDHWNKLPDNVVSAATISSFKMRLDIWMDINCD